MKRKNVGSNFRNAEAWKRHAEKCPRCGEWLARAKAMKEAGKLEKVMFLKFDKNKKIISWKGK